ncbi:hypothetical protein PGT21_033195 [Puccinia graminis f. sp. tritici]|uniref:C2H2-type domain-containing protein n=1 Tax=Puccinia graminis f. sp. tritici TaxID=56615 RepID=A0A5B0N7F4_PUCGR|nr:hypothetical protein PGT21_033195 [Puccinia graminis f. sp. tritici]KAA1099144.1 hypothetical protein PGTUg99_001048 [Puccinia graminis f. sp. tritici]
MAPGNEVGMDDDTFLCNWPIPEPLGSPLMPQQTPALDSLAQPNHHSATAVPADVTFDSFAVESSNFPPSIFNAGINPQHLTPQPSSSHTAFPVTSTGLFDLQGGQWPLADSGSFAMPAPQLTLGVDPTNIFLHYPHNMAVPVPQTGFTELQGSQGSLAASTSWALPGAIPESGIDPANIFGQQSYHTVAPVAQHGLPQPLGGQWPPVGSAPLPLSAVAMPNAGIDALNFSPQHPDPIPSTSYHAGVPQQSGTQLPLGNVESEVVPAGQESPAQDTSDAGPRYIRLASREFKCCECGLIVKKNRRKNMTRHISTKHPKPGDPQRPLYECDKCGKSYMNSGELAQHERDNHDAPPPKPRAMKQKAASEKFPCQVAGCEREYVSLESHAYYRHLQEKHGLEVERKIEEREMVPTSPPHNPIAGPSRPRGPPSL